MILPIYLSSSSASKDGGCSSADRGLSFAQPKSQVAEIPKRTGLSTAAGIHSQLLAAGGHGRTHYGTKPGHFETSKIHFPTSSGVSEVSERANE